MTGVKQPPHELVDRLIVIILASEQVGEISSKLVKHGYRLTLVTTTGGFMQAGSTCLLVGIRKDQEDNLMNLIGSVCRTHRQFIPAGGSFNIPGGLPPLMIEAEVGSAYVYSLEVEHYEFF